MTEDGGASWRKIERVPGRARSAPTSRDLVASRHDADTVYAAFDNHKNGRLQALPAARAPTAAGPGPRSPATCRRAARVWTHRRGPRRPAACCSPAPSSASSSRSTAARSGSQLKGGLPTIAVRDLAIQKRENDLVLGTFGRGFYVLDDYTPLRVATPATARAGGGALPGQAGARRTSRSSPLGLRGKAFQGESLYTAPNPPFGAVFTYYLKDELKTRKKARQDAEKEADEEGRRRSPTRAWDDAARRGARGGAGDRAHGHRRGGQRRAPPDRRRRRPASTAWPGTCASRPRSPTRLEPPPADNPFVDPPEGPLAAPGPLHASRSRKRVDGVLTPLGEPQTFEVEPLGLQTLPAAGPRRSCSPSSARPRACSGPCSARSRPPTRRRPGSRRRRRRSTTRRGPLPRSVSRRAASSARLDDLMIGLRGDRALESRYEATSMTTTDRIQAIVGAQWSTTVAPTATQPQGLRRRGRRIREAARHAAHARGHGPARARDRDGEGRRALDPGPHADLDEGVAGESRGRRRYWRIVPRPSTLNSRAALTPAGSPSRTTLVSFVPFSEMSSSTGP